MSIDIRRKGGVGESVRRVDAIPKVKGDFEYASDLRRDGMLYGATLRSPHPHARIASIDAAAAAAAPGVQAVLTHADVPGKKTFGLDVQDQPVLAVDVVRYAGEPVAIVAAEDPEVARAALKKITVTYEVHTPVTDMERALEPSSPFRPPTAGSTYSLRPSGSTPIMNSSRPAWGCRRKRCGFTFRAWVGLSGLGRTSACRSTPACSPSALGDQSR